MRLRDRLAQRIELRVVSGGLQIKRRQLLVEQSAVVLLREGARVCRTQRSSRRSRDENVIFKGMPMPIFGRMDARRGSTSRLADINRRWPKQLDCLQISQ